MTTRAPNSSTKPYFVPQDSFTLTLLICSAVSEVPQSSGTTLGRVARHREFLSSSSPSSSSPAQHVCLELQQLAHEGQVGRDDLAPLLHKVKGFVQPDASGVHEVGQADGSGAGDACLAVHQHSAAALFHRVCGGRSEYYTLLLTEQ